MKIKKIILSCLIVLSGKIIAQQAPTGTATGTIPPSLPNSSVSWFRGGNFAAGTGANFNLFGTALGFNSPIYTITNGNIRMQLNGDFNAATQYNVNGWSGTTTPNINTSGYLLLGEQIPGFGPFSMFHINGGNQTYGVQFLGFRPWMKYGMNITSNTDQMYVGHKANSTIGNETDAVFQWSNDPNTGFGPDNMVFIFTSGTGTATGNTADLNGNDYDGREIMRLTGYGNVGIGPRFNNTTQPQSDLHINSENNTESWLQISNESGTGQTLNDGLKIGYTNTNATNRPAYFIQQENERMIFQTNNGERLKIMHIGSLNNGINFNPGGLAANLTRIAISHNPSQPIDRPLSLLHLGYDVQGATNDGWRPWMDVGMFVSQESDNVFLGLKREPAGAPLGDKMDAVLSWGDNQINSGFPPGNGPDNFRIIFTSSTTPSAGGTPPATGANGLEGLRMTPTANNGVFTGIGGDPTFPNLYGPLANSINPTNTLEINSWGATNVAGGSSGLRFTNLNTTSPTLTNPGNGVLSVDSNGDVIYVDGTTGTGNYCTAPAQNPLIGNYEIPLAGFDYFFSGQNTPNDNRVAIGVPCSFPLPPAKLSVLEQAVAPVVGIPTTIAGAFANRDLPPASVSPFTAVGVYGISDQTQTFAGQRNIGGLFRAENSRNNIGVLGQSTSTLAGVPKFGVYGLAGGGGSNYGVYGESSPIITSPVTASNNHWAIYANGALYAATSYLISDGLVKKDVLPIAGALDIINHLNPIKYNFDVTLGENNGVYLPNSVQYGFKAQDVEQVLPELVTGIQNPAVFDSLGNEVIPAYNFKALNYNAFIGILAAGIQEQQSQLNSKDSAINSLNDRLTALENCINSLNLCGNNHNQINNSNTANITNVDLKDGQSIVLEQNVPNPFAEQTTINYFLPDDVKKAQLLFYNAQGKLIQTLDLTQKGKGSINVFAQDLSTGVYTYTLVADGQIVETKKMVKN